MESYRIEVGHQHKIKPGNIVGAIANEAGMDSRYIGRIDIHDDYSVVDLPQGMPDDVFRQLKDVRVGGQRLAISRLKDYHPDKVTEEKRPRKTLHVQKAKAKPGQK